MSFRMGLMAAAGALSDVGSKMFSAALTKERDQRLAEAEAKRYKSRTADTRQYNAGLIRDKRQYAAGLLKKKYAHDIAVAKANAGIKAVDKEAKDKKSLSLAVSKIKHDTMRRIDKEAERIRKEGAKAGTSDAKIAEQIAAAKLRILKEGAAYISDVNRGYGIKPPKPAPTPTPNPSPISSGASNTPQPATVAPPIPLTPAQQQDISTIRKIRNSTMVREHPGGYNWVRSVQNSNLQQTEKRRLLQSGAELSKLPNFQSLLLGR